MLAKAMSSITSFATPKGRTRVKINFPLYAVIATLLLLLVLIILLPLISFFGRSLQSDSGEFVGLENFARYFHTPALVDSIGNSFFAAGIAALIAVTIAFFYAYGLQRSCVRGKPFFWVIPFLPMFAPSLLPAISLIYLFGNQGIFNNLLAGHSIYGPIGVVLGLTFYIFPHAFIILYTSLSHFDARLQEASVSLGGSNLKTFFRIVLPSTKYGIFSAVAVAFTLAITDFGVPVVLGGRFSMLATDIYSNVIGKQDMEMAAVVGVILLIPAAVSFVIERVIGRNQAAALSVRAVPYVPKPNRWFDKVVFFYCTLVAIVILGILFMAAYGSLVTFWPYNLELTLNHYNLTATTDGGVRAYFTSLRMSILVAAIGVVVIFLGAYLVEKPRAGGWGRSLINFLAMVPMAVPGMVLGLAYIIFFNNPANPLNILYGTLTVMVMVTIAHFYTVGHLTAISALKQLDNEFESVSASLRVPTHRLVSRVTLPICLPTVFNVGTYLFINGMTTVSAIIFLYVPETKTASILMLFQEDNGKLASALALGVLIVLTSGAAQVLYWVLSRTWLRNQRWY